MTSSSPKEAEELGAIIPSRGHGPLLSHCGGSQEAGTYEDSFLPTSHPSLNHANRVRLPSLREAFKAKVKALPTLESKFASNHNTQV